MTPYQTFLTSALLLLISAAHALDDDRNQPIRIDSASAFADYKNGITTYEGNVVLSQGSLLIKADKISIQRDKTGFRTLIATGHPVQIQQNPVINKPPILAEANEINYDITSETLTLKDNVYIKLEESIHRGTQYEYNLATQRLKASGTTGNRITTTFQPQNPPARK